MTSCGFLLLLVVVVAVVSVDDDFLAWAKRIVSRLAAMRETEALSLWSSSSPTRTSSNFFFLLNRRETLVEKSLVKNFSNAYMNACTYKDSAICFRSRLSFSADIKSREDEGFWQHASEISSGSIRGVGTITCPTLLFDLVGLLIVNSL